MCSTKNIRKDTFIPVEFVRQMKDANWYVR